MNDRFKFRATFTVSYYDENGNDKDIKLTVYDVAVYSGGEIGFSAQQTETTINALKLPEIEEDTIWQFINDNYATSSYEWFVCDNAIIEQCTGLKDKNGNLIYEGDIVKAVTNTYKVIWDRHRWAIKNSQGYFFSEYINDLLYDCEIIGNIHKINKLWIHYELEQKD